MKKLNINLGDLVRLDGLEKPGEGVLKVELGARVEKINQLGEGMSDFAGKIEDNDDLKVGEVAGLVEVMKKALVKELSPEKAVELLKVLKKRFLNKAFFGFVDKKRHYKTVEGIKWEDVEKKLQNSPGKMWSLQQMEDTGGEPDLVEVDKKNWRIYFHGLFGRESDRPR